MNKKAIGEQGEALALKYLKEYHCEILAKNYRLKTGEIDIIVKDHGIIAFVEVKFRSNQYFGTPGQAVNIIKQRKIINTAMLYLQRTQQTQSLCRFDIVEIYRQCAEYKINWLKNAFEM